MNGLQKKGNYTYLIWSTTIESLMKPAIYNSISAKITAPMEKEYKYNSELVEFPGWKIVVGYDTENPEYVFLQTLKKNVEIKYNKIIAKVSLKDLKSHYTEAKLVQLLEQKGIGRPSTFSSLIDKIQERGYVKKDNVKGKKIKCVDYILEQDELTESEDMREFGNEKNKLVIQPIGILVLEFLIKHFNNLFEYEYTKNMETDLDLIAKGNKTWHDLCRDCNSEIDILSKDLVEEEKVAIPIDENHTYMIAKYGPVIKQHIGESIKFLPVKKDRKIHKILKNGEYKLHDIILTQNEETVIGKYKNNGCQSKTG